MIALMVAAPVARYGMQLWLSGFVYSIEMRWWMFEGGGMLVIIVALFTVSYQSVKTAIMNPVEWLRND